MLSALNFNRSRPADIIVLAVNITVEFVMASVNVKSPVEPPRFTIRNIFKAWKIWIEYLCFHIKNYTTGTGFLILKINYKNNHHFIIMLEKENINKNLKYPNVWLGKNIGNSFRQSFYGIHKMVSWIHLKKNGLIFSEGIQ